MPKTQLVSRQNVESSKEVRHIAKVENCECLNVRESPSLASDVLFLLNKNQLVELVNSQDDWANIRVIDGKTKNATGWVHTNYIVEV